MAKIYPTKVQILYLFFLGNSVDNLGHFSTSLRVYYQNSFSLIFFIVFHSKLKDVYEHVYFASPIV